MNGHICDGMWLSTSVQNGQSVDTYRCSHCRRVYTETSRLPDDD